MAYFIIIDVNNLILVAPLTNIPTLLLYKFKETEKRAVAPGKLIIVPIENRHYKAFVIEFPEKIPPNLKEENIKFIEDVLDLPPFFDEKLLNFYRFASLYYNVPLNAVLKSAFPELGGIKIETRVKKTSETDDLTEQIKKFFPKITLKELIHLEKIGVIKTETDIMLKKCREASINFLDIKEEKSISFTEEQEEIKKKVLSTLGKGVKHIFYGKTGSGKSELLIEITRELLEKGFSVLYMVPEISLVPHIYKRASAVVKNTSIFIWHSSINKNYRWQSLLKFSSEPSLLIGTRSSIFLPIHNVGLIIVDEEHDGSYKHEGSFPYNARDMAVMRGKKLSHPVILSSATPSIETYYYAKQHKEYFHILSQRFSPKKLDVMVVNTKEEEIVEGFFSKTLLKELKENIEKGLQSMIFINRRGYIPYIYCENCKRFTECSDCSAPLTWHKRKNLLSCHRCGKTYKTINLCPYCKDPKLSFFGAGTERIKELLVKMFPEANILKIDRDDTEKAGFFKRHLTHILDGTYNIIIATQIMAKGHHMPNLTLVGILLGEQGLSIPDFRAQERAFQLLSQVFGRSGREKEGKVVIQTSFPEAAAINFAIGDNYEAYYEYEIAQRKATNFPPFTRLLLIKIASKDENKSKDTADDIYNKLQIYSKGRFIYYAPQPAPLYRESGRFRYQIYVKAERYQELVRLVRLLKSEIKESEKIKILYDIDPYNVM